MKKVFLAMTVLAICASAPAAFGTVEATWKTDSTSVQQYHAVANWYDRSTGGTIAVAPTNAGDVAWFDYATNAWNRVRLPSCLTKTANNQLGTLHGTWHTRLLTYANTVDNGFISCNYVFNDLSDFQGTLYPDRTGASFIFTGGTPDVHVADLAVRLRPTVSVPAGTTVTADALHQFGTFEKWGAGTLKIGETALADSQFVYHNAGTLELVGHPNGVVTVPGDPAFWVDASNTNTMTLAEPDENGRLFITDWYDCRYGDGVHTKAATPINDAAVSRPWVSATEATLNGHTVVNFGAISDSGVSTYGPRAALQYDLGAKVKDLFIVWRDGSDTAATTSHFLGQTDGTDFARKASGYLFDASKASPLVCNGLLRLDGCAWNNDTSIRSGCYHLLNIALLGNGLEPNTFFDNMITETYGGGRLAEALFYTNTLTQAERGRVERYLQEKWFGANADVAMVRTAGASTPVSVSEGNVAKVHQVVVGGAKLVKNGAGTLKVGRFQPDSPTIDVNAGAVAFSEGEPTAGTDVPATNAVLWLDATQDSFEYASDGTSITKWKDCRASSSAYASRMTSWNYPKISTDTCNGNRVVDFGEAANASTRAAMSFSCGQGVIKEAFQVVKLPVQGSKQNVFGCAAQDLLRESTSTLLHYNYAYLAPRAGLWTMNGKTVDPLGSTPLDKDTWYVASFSSSDTCNCGYLAYERGVTIGDQRIGEFIGYTRTLTDAERRQTIAYLMKKWKGEDYAFAKAPAAIRQMNFTSGNATPTVVADADTEIQAVSFNGQTSFTKTGAGALTIDGSLPASLTDYAVEGDCTVKAPLGVFPDAAFHVDASRSDLFTFRAGQEADKRIDKWYDCNGRCRYAQTPLIASTSSDSWRGLTNAVLRTSSSSASGLTQGLPYVDFGDKCYAVGKSVNEVSAMKWFNADGTQYAPYNVREYHVVFAATNPGQVGPIGADLGEVDNGLIPSGNARGGFWSRNLRAVNSWKRLDGCCWHQINSFTANWGALPTTFHVLTLSFTNNVKACFFAADRNECMRGGIKLCEAVVFTGNTNSLARAEEIHQHLLNKWRGIGENPISTNLDRVQIASGGSLSLTSSVPFSVASIAGGGTLKVPGVGLRGLASIDASFDAAGRVTGSKVQGDVSFAPTVTVNVTVAAPSRVKGLYTIFSADALKNVKDVAFSRNVTNPGRRRYLLVKTATALQLKIDACGFVLILH